jgi:hypothetical protein
MEHRTDFRNASTIVLHLHKILLNRPREMSRERSPGQPGTIEIGPVEPRKLDAPGSHGGFACEHSGGIREGFQPGIEIGVELARNSLQRQGGFAQEEKVERHWI